MGLIYRITSTPNAGTGYTVKNQKLTWEELDGNFAYISASYVSIDAASGLTFGTASNVEGGLTNAIPLWTGPTKLGYSVMYQVDNNIGIGTATPAYKLDVANAGNFRDGLTVSGSFIANTGTQFLSSATITGSLFGTASYSSYTVSASYAATASTTVSASYAVTASTTVSASFASTASFITASNVYGPHGGSSILSASYAVSSSFTTVASSATSASYAATASIATSSSYAATASIATSSSYAQTASVATSASYAVSASYAPNAASVGQSISQGTGITEFTYDGATAQTVAVSGAVNLTQNKITKWTGTAFANSSLADNGIAITGTAYIQLTGASSTLSGSFSGSFSGNGENITGVVTSSYAQTASIATSASYSDFATSASYAATASIATSSSYAATASIATSASYAQTASYSDFATSASYAATASYAPLASNVQGGTDKYLPIWSGSTALSSSIMYQTGSSLIIGPLVTSSGYSLQISPDISGSILASGSIVNSFSSTRLITSESGTNTLALHALIPANSPNATNYFVRADGSSVFVNAASSAGNIDFRLQNATYGRIYNTTGNLGLQNAGTFTDNGYKLQVGAGISGSLWVSGSIVISGSLTVSSGSTEFQVLGTGIKIGNAVTDQHTVTGSINITGSLSVSNGITGSIFGTASNIQGGTSGYLPVWTGSTALSSSVIYQTGSSLLINTQFYDYYTLDVSGSARVLTNLVVGPVYTGSILNDRNYGIRVNTPMSGASNVFGVVADGEIQSGTTNNAYYFRSFGKFAATGSTLGSMYHFTATQTNALGSGSTIGTQVGYWANSGLISASNNWGFLGDLPASSSGGTPKNWNLYMQGDAPNYIAGALQIGSNTLGTSTIRIGRSVPSASVVIHSDGALLTGSTDGVTNYQSGLRTAASSLALTSFVHFKAIQASIGAGTSVSSQTGFLVDNTFTSTNNFGFRGQVPVGASNWNLYMEGGAPNFLSGSLVIGTTTSQGYKLQVSGSGNFTNGLTVTGSFTVASGSTEFQVLDTGIKIGNTSSDTHTVTGSLTATGSLTILNSGDGATLVTLGTGTTSGIQFVNAGTPTSRVQMRGYSASVETVRIDSVLGTYFNSVAVTGSFTVITGSAIELQVTNTGVKIGSVITDTHTVTGSINISGSTTIVGTLSATGSLFGTASYAQTASFVTLTSGNGTTAAGTAVDLGGTLTSDVYIDGGSSNYSVQLGSPTNYLNTFKVTTTNGKQYLLDSTGHTLGGSVTITGPNTVITGSLEVSGRLSAASITGSLLGTSSWANNASTASYITASNVYGPHGLNSVISSSYAVTSSRAMSASYATLAQSYNPYYYAAYSTSSQNISVSNTFQLLNLPQKVNSLGVTATNSEFTVLEDGVYRVDISLLAIADSPATGGSVTVDMELFDVSWEKSGVYRRIFTLPSDQDVATLTHSYIVNMAYDQPIRFVWKGSNTNIRLVGSGSITGQTDAQTLTSAIVSLTQVANNYSLPR